MERYSILDPGTPSFPPEEVVSQSVAPSPIPVRSTAGSISAAIAAANAALDLNGNDFNRNDLNRNSLSALRFPGDDGGQSLADMATRDLDAALQLLADRAQFITGATGAAIALRRSGRKDMLCRASTGSNAPGLGALLSAEAGLSGESVRTRTPLRCDDTERDPRVNRDGCRELGIASVIIMPIESDDQVLGVFELFSGQVNAFGERDLSALQRLAGMVETAVRVTQAPESSWLDNLGVEEPPAELAAWQEAPHQAIVHEILVDTDEDLTLEDIAEQVSRNSRPIVAEAQISVAAPTGKPLPDNTLAAAAAPAPKKPLFWSAAAAANSAPAAERDQSHIPAVLRNLHKCQACNFPVSEGRKLCVECEEKKWRGQLRYPAPVAAAAPEPAKPAAPAKPSSAIGAGLSHASVPAKAPAPAKPVNVSSAPKVETPAAAKVQTDVPQTKTFPELPSTAFLAQAPAPAAPPKTPAHVRSGPVASGAVPSEPVAAVPSADREANSLSSNEIEIEIEPVSTTESLHGDTPAVKTHAESRDEASALPILSGGIGSEQSWFSRNKYILGTLVVVGAAIAAVVFLR